MNQTVSQYFLSKLSSWGVRHVFGLPGQSLFPLLEAFEGNTGISFHTVRNEQSATVMASAAAKLTGTLGVCMADAGPGAINMLNGLYDATKDGVPVLAIAGQVRRDRLYTQGVQYSNQELTFRDATVFSGGVYSASAAETQLRNAVVAARTKGGAALLSCPVDVLSAPLSPDAGSMADGAVPQTSSPYLSFDNKSFEALVGFLNSSEAPVILAGRGAKGNADHVIELAEKLGAGIVVSLPGKGVIPETHPQVLGTLGDAGNEYAHSIINQAREIVIIGSTWWPENFVPKRARIARIDFRPASFVRPGAQVDMFADLHTLLPELVGRIVHSDARREWLETVLAAKKQWNERVRTSARSTEFPVHPARLISEMEAVLPGNCVVCLDTGDHTLWYGAHFRCSFQDTLVSGNWRMMGFGLPAAIAAKLMDPHRTVVALVGDGGLSMTISELATAVSLNTPIAVIVANNGSLALERHEQIRRGYEPQATDLRRVEFAPMARSMGALGERANSPGELALLLRRAVELPKPFVVDVPTALVAPPEVSRRLTEHLAARETLSRTEPVEVPAWR